MIQILKKSNYSFHNNIHRVSEMREPFLPPCLLFRVWLRGRKPGAQTSLCAQAAALCYFGYSIRRNF